MIPDKTDPRWKKLVSGEIKHNFKSMTAGLAVTRLSRAAQKDSSPAAMSAYIDEIWAFFKKFEGVFEQDIQSIFG